MLRYRFLFACLVAILSPASNVQAGNAVFPYAVGNRWEYSIMEIGVMSVGENDRSGSTGHEQEGTDVEEVLSVKERRPNGDIVYETRSTETYKDGINAKAREVVTEALEMVAKNGIYDLGHRVSGMDDGRQPEWVSNDPPLLAFPDDLVFGRWWKIGTLRDGDLSMSLEAKFAGYEDVHVSAGDFQNCMKLIGVCRKMSGTMGTGNRKARIIEGRTLHTMWAYPGVGIVKEITLTQARMQFTAAKSGVRPPVVTLTRRENKELLPGYRIQ